MDNAKLKESKASDNTIINMKADINQGQLSGNAVMTGETKLNNGKISDNGILAGKGTSCNSCQINGGRVFDGVSCTHSVSAEHRHWDNRSCKKQIDTLKDEREGCLTPGAEDCRKEQPPPTIC